MLSKISKLTLLKSSKFKKPLSLTKILLSSFIKKMFVILETGGKQYRVSEGNTINVEKLDANEGDKVVLSNILFVQKDNGEIIVGQPTVENVEVEAEVVENYREEKVIIFKKRRRKNSRRKNGHRQEKTELKILNIKLA